MTKISLVQVIHTGQDTRYGTTAGQMVRCQKQSC